MATATAPPDVASHDESGQRKSATTKRRKLAGRTKLKQPERIKVWVRAGGVCVLCKTYLLEGALTGLGVSLGELAHIVGQQDSVGSPRGRHPMPRADRDTAENVMLACESCHGEIDHQLVTGILDVARLMTIKATHEQRIRHVTTLPDDQRSLVLRVVGKLRGEPVELTRSTAAKTVIDSGRFPWFDLDRDRLGVEVDLRSLPGERTADASYYRIASRAIDEVLETRLQDAIRSGDVRHVSVFAFARLPLLIYLGAQLDDNCAIEVYQRHRNTQEWVWDDGAEDRHFTVSTNGALHQATEAVLILNVSGEIDVRQTPGELAALPTIVIAPDATPSPDVLASRGSLNAFRKAVREVNARLDATKGIRRLHVIGALPPAAAVELGRSHDPHIHPVLVIYSRTDDDTYLPALEIP